MTAAGGSGLQISARGRKFMNMPQTAKLFQLAAINRARQSAQIATDVSRATFSSQLSGRPLAPPRTGRPTTGGGFANEIVWVPIDDSIKFDFANLAGKAPYYLIQEIGTGQSAAVLNPPGGVSVRSQRGRLISMGLVWASSSGGAATPPGQGSLQQIFPAADLTMNRRKIRIRREIKGKHYIRDGGFSGFSYLDANLRADALRIFF